MFTRIKSFANLLHGATKSVHSSCMQIVTKRTAVPASVGTEILLSCAFKKRFAGYYCALMLILTLPAGATTAYEISYRGFSDFLCTYYCDFWTMCI